MAKPKQPDPFPDLAGERFFSVNQVAAMFPGRSRRWVVDRLKTGQFGTVLKDEGAWLIPLSGLRAYVQARAVEPAELAPELQAAAGAGNLVQFRKSL